MTRIPLIIALAATAALAGCNEDHTIVAGPAGDEETNSATDTPIELPPSIASSKIYRCADNDVVYVDWLSDGSANLRPNKDAGPTHLSAAEPGKSLTAEGGYSLTGTPTATSVRIAVPGQSEETCKA